MNWKKINFRINDNAEDIRNKLETLIGDEKLSMDAILGLSEILNELKNRPIQRIGGGGGTSDMGVTMSLSRIIRKETPTGTIDGSNTIFTVSANISAILSFSINGMAINDDEYTYSGKTITFTTAIPADLSGTSFRITYV